MYLRIIKVYWNIKLNNIFISWGYNGYLYVFVFLFFCIFKFEIVCVGDVIFKLFVSDVEWIMGMLCLLFVFIWFLNIRNNGMKNKL